MRRLNNGNINFQHFSKKNSIKNFSSIFFCLFQFLRCHCHFKNSSKKKKEKKMNFRIPTVFAYLVSIYLILIGSSFKCLTDSSPTTTSQNSSERFDFENGNGNGIGKKRFRCTSPLGSSDGSIVLESEDGELSGLTTLQVCKMFLIVLTFLVWKSF